MAITYNTRTYNLDELKPDSAKYTGPAHTMSEEDTLTLSRVRPKKNGSSLGTARSTFRQARTAITNPATGEVGLIVHRSEWSVPVWAVGSTDVTTKLDAMRADYAAAVNTSLIGDLAKTQDVNV